jgi:transcriptional regulator with XRE-family HTH domain
MPTLGDLRRAAGLTQWEVAQSLHTRPPQVSAWERGAAVPSTRFLRPLAGLLGVSVDELLSVLDQTAGAGEVTAG